MIYLFSLKNYVIFLSSIFFSLNLFATNISTINIAYILENTNAYITFLDKISNKEQEIETMLSQRGFQLDDLKKEIKESELIISKVELENSINEYNNNLKILENDFNYYNEYFTKNIDLNKEIIINHIIEIINEISDDLDFDIILSEQHYFMSTKKIDISDKIINFINQKNIILDILDE